MNPVAVHKAARTADAVRRHTPWKKIGIVAAVGLVAQMVAVLMILQVFVVAGTKSRTVTSTACAPVAAGEIPGNGETAASLNATQTAHATTIIAVGQSKGITAQGIVVALATASQESRFRNYANDGKGSDLRVDQADVARSVSFPHDAVGTDHGSVNVFQQQYPWWGTLEELMNPVYAAGKFFDTLLTVDGWESLPVTAAAQRVQRSAFPFAYADDEPLARDLYAVLAGSASIVPVNAAVCATAPALELGAHTVDGFTNGRIPADALCPLPSFPGELLHCDAAPAFEALVAAYGATGGTIGVTDSYRDYASQIRVAAEKGLYSEGGLAANPGTSNHGWGLSLDLRLSSSALAWMRSNAGRYGYVEDVPRESWHWTFHGIGAA